ncbi:hypothetical protein [Agrobacterium sp. M50-1]|uniref:hypothetical protein n=1 Tax=Agrobacterium sp. M50-1 TaxID=3132821 RepID=UPI003CE47FE4
MNNHKISGIDAALMEARGEGNFSIESKSIFFKSGKLVWEWKHYSHEEAVKILKVLRAAPKYI